MRFRNKRRVEAYFGTIAVQNLEYGRLLRSKYHTTATQQQRANLRSDALMVQKARTKIVVEETEVERGFCSFSAEHNSEFSTIGDFARSFVVVELLFLCWLEDHLASNLIIRIDRSNSYNMSAPNTGYVVITNLVIEKCWGAFGIPT